jgi:hypothetical protein
MNRRIFAVARVVLSVATVGIAMSAAAAEQPVDASELARCAAISSGNERLACYDALAVVAVPGLRIAPATAAPGAASSATAAPGGGAAPAAAVSGAAAQGPGPGTSAATSAPAARTADPDDPANFGLTRHQLKVIPQSQDSVKATVSQMTEDRLNNVYLLLDNGQTWGFVEPSPRVRPGDSVTIKRAALGSFLMTTPSRRSYRVQRVN